MRKTALLLLIVFLPFAKTSMAQKKSRATTTATDQPEAHGNCYKTLQDYMDDKPMPGAEVQYGSWQWDMISGTKYKIKDASGTIKTVNAKNFPSDLFTYRNGTDGAPFLMRVMDKEPYIVLAAGKLNFYSLFQAQSELFYSEGWDGERKKFKEKELKKYLLKYDLLQAYENEEPKRRSKDGEPDYFNRTVQWRVKYFNLLNDKM